MVLLIIVATDKACTTYQTRQVKRGNFRSPSRLGKCPQGKVPDRYSNKPRCDPHPGRSNYT